MSLVLGIDLGTTNSCAAIFRNGKVEVVKTKEEDSVTPSFVFYDTDKVTIGKEAINLSSKNPRNGIFDSKRFLGRYYDDPLIHKAPIFFPFKILKNKSNEPFFELQYLNGTKRPVRPEEVSAWILVKILEDSLRCLKEEIQNVVITVPAYFSIRQRQATESAARIAGLNVLKLLSEPTAAALAFFEDDSSLDKKTVLVYDLGGGTFDVSVIKFENGEGNVIAVGGDAFLGGRDFDDSLVKLCLTTIKDKYKYAITNQSPEDQRRSGRRLRQACEDAKKQLSDENMQSTTVELEHFQGLDVEVVITRKKFEELNAKLFNRTIEIVEATLKDAKISKKDIDDVILVGGSTRIPKVEKLVKEFFNKKSLNKKVHREEGVAIGAALQAALLSNHPSQRRKIFIKDLTDVTPLSLGIKVFSKSEDHENCSVIIKRNTQIPVAEIKSYRTSKNYQTVVDLHIFEGENKIFKNNFYLGLLSINGVTPKKAGEVMVVVKFELNFNGILIVSATETLKNEVKTLQINLNSGQLSEEEIKKIHRYSILNYNSHEADKVEA